MTVAGDSEAAKVVEAANARYAALLTTKQAADKYTDQETQTLAPLHKAREVQAGILTTTATGCQATIWDLADTYDLLEQATALQAAAGGEGGAGGEGTGGGAAAAGTGPGAVTVGQLAGAVARGEGYGAGVGGGSRSTNPQMGHSFARTESTANSTIMASWAHNPMVARVTGMMPGSMGGNRPTDSARTSATGEGAAAWSPAVHAWLWCSLGGAPKGASASNAHSVTHRMSPVRSPMHKSCHTP